jgi:ABC-type uncharacterized transport system involved in gliding motility auxiliary subunit
LLAGAIVCANLTASRLARRVDLTGDHIYTLSEASRALVRGLPDPLTVKAYFSADLPPAQAAVARYASELLEEYRLASGGQLHYQIEDPASDPRIDEQAGRCRVGKLAIQTRHTGKLEVAQRFLGLCLWYDGRSRALAPLDPGAALEYQISALIKVMSQRRRKVAFTVGHGERDLGTAYSFVKRLLDHEVDVITLDPSTAVVGDDVDLLVIAGPRRPFDERARRAIEASVASARPALFLIDGMSSPGDGDDGVSAARAPQAITTGLEPLLSAYGFRVGRDVVFDRRNVPGPLPAPPGGGARAPALVNFPAFVAVQTDRTGGGDPSSILTGIDALVFPFASSLQISGAGAAGGARGWTLARTSGEAWTETGAFGLTPDSAPTATGARRSVALAGAYQGPPLATRSGAGATAAPRSLRLVVVADSDFVSDRYMELLRAWPIYAGGPELLLNAVGWALEDDALTALRARVLRARPLDVDAGAAGAGALILLANVAGVPLAVCAAGLLRWRWRTSARRRQRLPRAGGGSP